MQQPNPTNKTGKRIYTGKTSLLFLFLLSSALTFSQNFAWMKGSNLTGQAGVYGTLGSPSVNNTPGARDAAISWKDASGNFWLFGGFSIAGLSNDLWKYTVSTNQWTWINGLNTVDNSGVYGTIGVASPLNMPGSRSGGVSWVDASGNLWLFGGDGWDGAGNIGSLNDLWKYNITTNQWTWMKGSNAADQNSAYGTIGVPANGNSPGGRDFCATWPDASGNLWLFGGTGFDGAGNYGDLNDLWKYNITSNQWTWMKGTNTTDQNGIYGSLGVAAAGNRPGGRYLPCFWADASGNLWLFGGSGYDASTNFEDYMNDLWKYNITANQWTWVKGSNISGQQGNYGTLGTGAPSNVPGGRAAANSWSDASGNLFLFGGAGYDGATGVDLLNDLWQYNITGNQWTWTKGSNVVTQLGTYGTQGVAASGNMPGARGGASGWTDSFYNLWLFGGFGYDGTGPDPDDLNDLWRLSNCITLPAVTITSSTLSLCTGNAATLTASGANTYLWSNTQTGSVTVVSPTLAGTTSYTAYGSDLSGCTGSAAVSINVQSLPVINVTNNKPVMCKGDQATLVATGAANYSWNTSPVNTNATIVVSPTVNTIYIVTGTAANGCSNTYSMNQVVNPCTGIEAGSVSTSTHVVFPNPSNGNFNFSGPAFEKGSKLIIFNTLGQKVFEENLSSDQMPIETQLKKGVYQFQILLNDQKISTGKLLIE